MKDSTAATPNADSPYAGRALHDDAWKKGRAARQSGKPRSSCPLGDYPGKAFARAWGEGWDSVPVIAQAPMIRVQSPPIATPGAALWPKEKALPTHYQRPVANPCVKCRAVTMTPHARALIVEWIKDGIAAVRCRACGARYQLPVKP